jgi:L-fucose isomerase-like protein
VRVPRVALLSPFWSFWERSAAVDLREDRRRLARRVAEALDGFVVVADESLDSPETAMHAATRILRAEPDVLVVVQSMAVPPAYTLAALDLLGDVPLVVWAVGRGNRLASSFGHSDITIDGATVGTSQLANVLARRGRGWAPIVGPLEDTETRERLRAAVRAAAVSRWLRTARVGLVGLPPDGYECVECDPAELSRAIGTTIVPIRPVAFQHAYRAPSDERLAEVEAQVRADFDVDPATERDGSLARSLRCALALEGLVRDGRLDAGALNCHVPEIRFGEEPGITPCLALGLTTTRGVPWTCTGDVPTAIAMLTAKWLGAATLYHELESIDHETGELVIANTGEHDLGWSAPDTHRRLTHNGWFASDPQTGVCACFGLRPGPATLLAFTPHAQEQSGFRYIVAEGEITGREFPGTGTPNGAFRFAGSSAGEGYRAWALEGASHHSCASPGHLAAALAQVAENLGVGCVRICPTA